MNRKWILWCGWILLALVTVAGMWRQSPGTGCAVLALGGIAGAAWYGWRRFSLRRAPGLAVLAAGILLELTLGQFFHYRMVFAGEREWRIPASELRIEGARAAEGKLVFDADVPVAWAGKGCRISVSPDRPCWNFKLLAPGAEGISLLLDFQDGWMPGTASPFFSFGTKEPGTRTFSSVGRLKQFHCRLWGAAGAPVPFEGIAFNVPEPVRIHWWWLGGVLVCAAVVQAVCRVRRDGRKIAPARAFIPFLPEDRRQRMLFHWLYAVFAAVAVGCYIFSTPDWLAIGSAGNELDNYSRELTDAFAAGRTSLALPAYPELMKLSNPYDPRERLEAGAEFPMDTLLYQGKFYSYFGAAPCLLLQVPFKMATGLYLKPKPQILAFTLLAGFFLLKLVLLMAERFCRGVPFSTVFWAAVAGLAGSNLLVCVPFGVWRYFLVLQAGLCCALAGSYFLIRALTAARPDRAGMIWGGVLLALTAACRPSISPAALLVLPFGIAWLTRRCRGREWGELGRGVAAIALPVLAVGAAVMYYNFVRFGNVLDFGVNYQLSIADFRYATIQSTYVLQGLWEYWFAPPELSGQWPFLICRSDFKWDIFGSFGYNEHNFIGIVYLMPYLTVLVWGWLCCRRRSLPMTAGTWMAVLGLGIAAVDCGLCGTSMRYLTDAVWLWNLGAIFWMLALGKRFARVAPRRWAWGWTAVVIWSLAANVLAFFAYCGRQLY